MLGKYVWPLATSLIVAIMGASLMVWPWTAHALPGHWTRAVYIDFWSGIGLVITGLVGLAGWYGGLRRELVRQGIVADRHSAPDPQPEDTAPAAGEDLDRLLRPLAETVLRDLSEQLAAKQSHSDGGGPVS